jgi:hypothetical protein
MLFDGETEGELDRLVLCDMLEETDKEIDEDTDVLKDGLTDGE